MYEARQDKRNSKHPISRKLQIGIQQRVQIKDGRCVVLQGTFRKKSFSGGNLYMISRTDLGTGSETNETTRSHVNNYNTTKPTQIRFDYDFDSNSENVAAKKVMNSSSYFWVNNPIVDHTYATGRYWDAGHKLAKQNGGYGDDINEVFPQSPFINQGNSRLMDNKEEAYPLWREHEMNFYNGVKEQGYGCWWIYLI